MVIQERFRASWAKSLLKELGHPVSEGEKARRRAATKRLRALRDELPSIAPDSAAQYIRETRAEADDAS